MSIGQKREQVHFERSKPWDNYPEFGTRLDQAYERVYSFIWDHRVMVPVLFFLFLCVFTIISIAKDKFIEGLVGLVGTLIITYIGLVVTIYWNLDSVYGRKWALFFERWYEINNIENPTERNMHFYNLYMDVITMKLWGDPAISKCFKHALLIAIKRTQKDRSDEIIERLNNGKMDTYEAYGYLSAYAAILAGDLVNQQKSKKICSQKSASLALMVNKCRYRANRQRRLVRD